MSRAYRITIKESLSRHVQVDDGVQSRLELLPILSKERTADLLAAELEKKGFTRQGDKAIRRDGDGVEVEIDLTTGDVSVAVVGHADIELKDERAGLVTDDARGAEETRAEGEARLRAQSRAVLEAQARSEEERLREQVTKKLSGKLGDLKSELDGVVNRVTADALKLKARELGTVEEVHEDANTGTLTIKVRV